MGNLFIIAGHGAGDSGACGGGYQEQERVRALGYKIKELGGDEVTLGDFSKNYYKSNLMNTIPKGSVVLELHMDSANIPSAKGGHVIIQSSFEPDTYDEELAEFISGYFPGRSTILDKRSDLANANRAKSLGLNYRLLECCFISNDEDREKFNANLDEIAKGILGCFEIDSIILDSENNESETIPSDSFLVKVIVPGLNIRKDAGANFNKTGEIKDNGIYTIVEVKKASDGGTWGRLKSGIGWINISLNFVKMV